MTIRFLLFVATSALPEQPSAKRGATTRSATTTRGRSSSAVPAATARADISPAMVAAEASEFCCASAESCVNNNKKIPSGHFACSRCGKNICGHFCIPVQFREPGQYVCMKCDQVARDSLQGSPQATNQLEEQPEDSPVQHLPDGVSANASLHPEIEFVNQVKDD